MGTVKLIDVDRMYWRGHGSPGSSLANTTYSSGTVAFLARGDEVIWTHSQLYEFTVKGTRSFSVPSWACEFAIFMVGGGAGGDAGNGGNGRPGNGGWSGKGHFTSGRIPPNVTNIQIKVGAGGLGGKKPGNTETVKGQNGEVSSFKLGNIYREANAGFGQRTGLGERDGESAIFPIDAQEAKRLLTYPGNWTTEGGTSNGADGKKGGGGSGGNGGFFTSYTKGGNGGDGYVRVVFWGRMPT